MRTLLLLIVIVAIGYGQHGRFYELMKLDADSVSTAGYLRVDSAYRAIIQHPPEISSPVMWYNFQSPFIGKKYKTVLGPDTVYSSAPYSAMTILTILQYWDAYKLSLEKDRQDRMNWWLQYLNKHSEYAKYYSITFSSDTVMVYGRLGSVRDIIVKERPTFEGFMEYLQEQRGKK